MKRLFRTLFRPDDQQPALPAGRSAAPDDAEHALQYTDGSSYSYSETEEEAPLPRNIRKHRASTRPLQTTTTRPRPQPNGNDGGSGAAAGGGGGEGSESSHYNLRPRKDHVTLSTGSASQRDMKRATPQSAIAKTDGRHHQALQKLPHAASARTTSALIGQPGKVSAADVEGATLSTLRNLCAELGVPAAGTKQELKERALARIAETPFDGEEVQGEKRSTRRAGDCMAPGSRCRDTRTTWAAERVENNTPTKANDRAVHTGPPSQPKGSTAELSSTALFKFDPVERNSCDPLRGGGNSGDGEVPSIAALGAEKADPSDTHHHASISADGLASNLKSAGRAPLGATSAAGVVSMADGTHTPTVGRPPTAPPNTPGGSEGGIMAQQQRQVEASRKLVQGNASEVAARLRHATQQREGTDHAERTQTHIAGLRLSAVEKSSRRLQMPTDLDLISPAGNKLPRTFAGAHGGPPNRPKSVDGRRVVSSANPRASLPITTTALNRPLHSPSLPPVRPTPLRASTSGFATAGDIVRTFNRYTPRASASPAESPTPMFRQGTRPSSDRFVGTPVHRIPGSAFGVPLSSASHRRSSMRASPLAASAPIGASSFRQRRHSTGFASFRQRRTSTAASAGRQVDPRPDSAVASNAAASLRDLRATEKWRHDKRAVTMAASAKRILQAIRKTSAENRVLCATRAPQAPIGPPPSLKRARDEDDTPRPLSKRLRRATPNANVRRLFPASNATAAATDVASSDATADPTRETLHETFSHPPGLTLAKSALLASKRSETDRGDNVNNSAVTLQAASQASDPPSILRTPRSDRPDSVPRAKSLLGSERKRRLGLSRSNDDEAHMKRSLKRRSLSRSALTQVVNAVQTTLNQAKPDKEPKSDSASAKNVKFAHGAQLEKTKTFHAISFGAAPTPVSPVLPTGDSELTTGFSVPKKTPATPLESELTSKSDDTPGTSVEPNKGSFSTAPATSPSELPAPAASFSFAAASSAAAFSSSAFGSKPFTFSATPSKPDQPTKSNATVPAPSPFTFASTAPSSDAPSGTDPSPASVSADEQSGAKASVDDASKKPTPPVVAPLPVTTLDDAKTDECAPTDKAKSTPSATASVTNVPSSTAPEPSVAKPASSQPESSLPANPFAATESDKADTAPAPAVTENASVAEKPTFDVPAPKTTAVASLSAPTASGSFSFGSFSAPASAPASTPMAATAPSSTSVPPVSFGAASSSATAATGSFGAFGASSASTAAAFSASISAAPFGSSKPSMGSSTFGSQIADVKSDAEKSASTAAPAPAFSFAASSQPATNPFGTSSSATFGSSMPAFGQSSSASAAPSSSAFGSSAPVTFPATSFGMSSGSAPMTEASTPFGSNTGPFESSSSAFGTQSANAFGSSASTFGSAPASSNPFASAPSFGAPTSNHGSLAANNSGSNAFGSFSTPQSGNPFASTPFSSGGNPFGNSSFNPTANSNSNAPYIFNVTPSLGANPAESTPFGSSSGANNAFGSGNSGGPFGSNSAMNTGGVFGSSSAGNGGGGFGSGAAGNPSAPFGGSSGSAVNPFANSNPFGGNAGGGSNGMGGSGGGFGFGAAPSQTPNNASAPVFGGQTLPGMSQAAPNMFNMGGNGTNNTNQNGGARRRFRRARRTLR